MVSQRPWTEVTDDWDVDIKDAEGKKVISCCGCCPLGTEPDDRKHIVAAVNAFHECGIEPGDLKAFVEAVRAWHKYLPTIVEKRLGAGVGEWIDLVHYGNAAAALLPENRGK